MTFEIWWGQYMTIDGNEVLSDYERDVARDAWNAAVEASAQKAAMHFIPCHSVAGPAFSEAGANDIRSMIWNGK